MDNQSVGKRGVSQQSALDKLRTINDPYMFSLESLDENDLQQIYHFVDKVQISKTKKNLNRDFADCSIMAEVIKHYLPNSHKGMIEVHNYISSS